MVLKNKIFLLLAIASTVQADFIHVSAWERQLQDGTKQSILFFGDVHDQEEVGFKQAQQIVHAVAQRNNKDDLLLVEDMNDAHDLAKRLDAYFQEHPHEQDRHNAAESVKRLIDIYEDERLNQAEKGVNATLFMLPYFAQKKDVNICNVDFRQFVSCDAPRLDISKYHNGHLIVPAMLETVVADIASFDDTPTLNAYYAQLLKRYTPFMQMMCNIMRNEKIIFQDLPDYFAKKLMKDPLAFELKQFKSASSATFNFYHELLGKALAFLRPTSSEKTYQKLVLIFVDLLDLSSVELIDAIIMHRLYQEQIATNKDNLLCVCVGEAHMLNVEKQLKQCGYKKIDAILDWQGVDVEAFCAKHVQQTLPERAMQSSDVETSMWARIVAAITYLATLIGL